MNRTYDPTSWPLAAKGLTSYRCKCGHGWIMIGATDHADAMVQARRSNNGVKDEDLQVWNGTEYVSAQFAGGRQLDHLETAQIEFNRRSIQLGALLKSNGWVFSASAAAYQKDGVCIYPTTGNIYIQGVLSLPEVAYSRFIVKAVDTAAVDVLDRLDVPCEEILAKILAEAGAALLAAACSGHQPPLPTS